MKSILQKLGVMWLLSLATLSTRLSAQEKLAAYDWERKSNQIAVSNLATVDDQPQTQLTGRKIQSFSSMLFERAASFLKKMLSRLSLQTTFVANTIRRANRLLQYFHYVSKHKQF